MREFEQIRFSALCDFIENAGDTLILLHTRPDADAVGSGFALKGIMASMGKNAFCLCADELPERLAFLALGQDGITESGLPSGFEAAAVISLDVASPSQLGTLEEKYAGRTDLMIDHHKCGTPFADNYIRADCAASGEIIFEVSRELCRRGHAGAVSRQIDERIYAAISSDTGCFKYSSVTPKTHRRAAALLASGIDSAEINRCLFDSKSPKVLTAEKLALENLRYFYGGKLSIIPFSSQMKKDNGLLDEHIETVVDIARTIEGVSVGVAVKQSDTDPRSFRVSMRSNHDVNVSDICASHGGGGHVRAAGCTIECGTIEEAIDIIVADLKPALGQDDGE